MIEAAPPEYRSMLTDDDIDDLARTYVRKRYGPVLPGIEPLWERQIVKHFDLEDPPGAYFTVAMPPRAPGKSGSSAFPGDVLVGDGGFFIDRRTGTVRHFGSGEFVHASSIVSGSPIHLGASAAPDHRQAVKYLLTHSTEMLRADLDALREPRSAKRWWEFWK